MYCQTDKGVLGSLKAHVKFSLRFQNVESVQTNPKVTPHRKPRHIYQSYFFPCSNKERVLLSIVCFWTLLSLSPKLFFLSVNSNLILLIGPVSFAFNYFLISSTVKILWHLYSSHPHLPSCLSSFPVKLSYGDYLYFLATQFFGRIEICFPFTLYLVWSAMTFLNISSYMNSQEGQITQPWIWGWEASHKWDLKGEPRFARWWRE